MTWTRVCVDAAATAAAGEELAGLLAPGDVVLLSGPLGAGKTTFTQGLARGLGVTDRVTSPTFTLVRPHACHNDRGIETLHHADVYRTGTLGEVLDLGLGELVEESAVAVVEWGELAAPAFGRDVMTIDVVIDEDESRRFTVGGALAEARGDRVSEWARS